jgi:HK97 family phage major capsid protein
MEPTFAEAKAAVDALNAAFNEFKATNDQRIKQIEAKGTADPILQQKLDKISADIEKHSAIADGFAALEAKFNQLKLAGVGSEEAKGLEAEVKQFNLELRSNATAQGRVVPATVSAEEFRAYKQNFELFLRRGEKAIDQKAMSVGSDPDGGYLVTPDMSGRMVKRIYETSPIRAIASIQTIGTDKLEGLRDIDEASGGGWVSETGSRAATTTPQFGKWEIAVHEQYENPGATQKLIDDASISIENWLSDKVADKMARREAAGFVSGTGIGQPKGFTAYTTAATADASRSWGQLEHVLSGTNGSWGTAPNGSDKLIDLVHKLKAHYRQGARFVMNRVTLGSARQLKADGQYIWLPSMEAGQPSKLLGYGVTEAEDMATYSTTGALAVAFGDFKAGYQIVDRIGVRVLRDPYTNKPYIQFYTTKRVGGDVVDFEAIKFLKFAS